MMSSLKPSRPAMGFPGGSAVKNLRANARDMGSIPGLGKFPWSRKWQPIPVSLPGKSHGQRSLVDYNPWGLKELDTTEQLTLHTHTHTHTHTHAHTHIFSALHTCGISAGQPGIDPRPWQ